MLNKKGDAGESPLWTNVIYLFLVLIFIIPLVGFINAQKDAAATWEDFYAKEIARMINSAEPGTEVFLDVTRAVGIASGRGQLDSGKIIDFDNVNNEVRVSLRLDGGTSYGFLNDVDIVEWEVIPASGGIDTFRLRFDIVEAQK